MARSTRPTSPRQPVAVWALSTTTTEAINREPRRVATGATAALTATDHSTTYPGGGASKKIMVVASPILPPARSAKCHDNQAKRPKTQRIAQIFNDSCIAVTVTCVAFFGFSTHPRLRVVAFLARAAKTKPKLAAACTQACTPSLSSTINRDCQPGVALDAA